MENKDFYMAWQDDLDVKVEIDWTKPFTHDLLFTNNIEEDDDAYFYSITACRDREWHPYYIGMVYHQNVSTRHKQPDHVERLTRLKKENPELNFSVCLGVPKLIKGSMTRKLIEAIEGLLIYGNWHTDMANEKKINKFSSDYQIYVKNTGFTEHLEGELAYGVMYRNTD